MVSTASSTSAGVQLYEAGLVQRREWMLYKIREDHYPLNVSLSFDVGVFDPGLIQRVINLLVQRHEVLRTTLRVVDDNLRQLVHDPAHFQVVCSVFDLRSQCEDEQKAFIATKKTLQSAMPFNFEYGPLFRVAVFARTTASCEISFVFHHVVFDQYSGEVLRRDAVRLWGALVGNAGQLPLTNGPQYREYTVFENQLLNTKLGDMHREYWQAQLAHGIPRLQIIDQPKWDEYYVWHIRKVIEVKNKLVTLPFYDPLLVASVIRRYRPSPGGGLDYVYRDETFKRVQEFRQKSNTSLHTLFIAGFLVALHRISGQELFGFDIPAFRKMDSGYRDMIGWLATGGVCFFNIRENHGTQSLLDHVEKQLYLLSKHCVYPFEALNHDDVVPTGSTMPVLFTLAESDGTNDFIAGNRLRGIVFHQRQGETSCQDMDLFLSVFTNGCGLHAGYNSFLIPPERMEMLIAGQEDALCEIIADALSVTAERDVPQETPA